MRGETGITIFLFLASTLLTQSRFEGTWEMKMDTARFSGGAEAYLLDQGIYHCLTCVPRVDVEMNGADQNVSGHPSFDSIAVRVKSANAVEFIMKKRGRPTFSCTETVSPSGNIMTEDFSDRPTSQPFTGKAVFVRRTRGTPGSHLLSGSWEMRTLTNLDGKGPTTSFQATKEGMKVTTGGSYFEAKFDGKDYPMQEDAGHSAVSLRMLRDGTIEEMDKQNGKIVRITRMTVSRDGQSMRVKSIDKQLGRISTYTSKKLP